MKDSEITFILTTIGGKGERMTGRIVQSQIMKGGVLKTMHKVKPKENNYATSFPGFTLLQHRYKSDLISIMKLYAYQRKMNLSIL